MPEPLWRRLGISVEDLRKKLVEMYSQGSSQSAIATHLGCHITCIENWCRVFSIEGRNPSQRSRATKAKTLPLSAMQAEIMDGFLLSDGHLEAGSFQSRASFGVKHLEFAEAIVEATEVLRWSKPRYNQRCLGWFSKSQFCSNLQDLRRRWYPEGVKIVPKDLQITPTVVLWWYLGDGSLCRYGAQFCTDAFVADDVTRLSSLLSARKIPCHVTPRNRIRVEGTAGVDALLNYIGPSPVGCYEYKWGPFQKGGCPDGEE